MSIIELFITSVGLAMDAFAVSICKGLSLKKLKIKHMIIVGAYFGIFQALMPLIGYILGARFEQIVNSFEHWVIFIILGLIGAGMIKESFEDNEDVNDSFSFKTMFPLAVATSIDALAVGITFAFLKVNIWLSIAMVGIVTFVISAIGVKVGNIFGEKYKNKAEFVGGLVLILIGLKILLEHFGII